MKQKASEKNKKIDLGDFVFLTISLVVVIATPYMVVKNHFLTGEIEQYSRVSSVIGHVILALLSLVVITNIYLFFIRPWRYKVKHGSLNNYQNISGIPLVGTVLVFLAALFLPPSITYGVVLMFLFLADVGGLHYGFFVIIKEYIYARKNN